MSIDGLRHCKCYIKRKGKLKWQTKKKTKKNKYGYTKYKIANKIAKKTHVDRYNL